MNSTERPQFEKQLQVLFGAWPAVFLSESRSEAYWLGLQKMRIDTFTRCVDQMLGEKGEEKLPTVHRIWQVSRELRANAPVQEQIKPTVELSIVWAYGNRAMLNYLTRGINNSTREMRGGASYESLLLMLAEKKRLCKAYELICEEEPEASLELRDKLFDAWDRVYVPMSPVELQEEQEFFWRTGRVRNWREPEHATRYAYRGGADRQGSLA